MLKIIICSIICFFAVYGVLQLAVRIAESAHEVGLSELRTPYTVMPVKNREDDIEALVRSEAWRMLYQNPERRVGDIVVIDLGSEDETLTILRRLSREYDFLHPMTKERYIEMLEEM